MTRKQLSVSLHNHQDDMSIALNNIEEIVNRVVDAEGQQADEASVTFVSDEEMCALHQIHFDDPTPTDCISFPMDGPEEAHYRVLGEVFVCPHTAITYATQNKLDPYRELTLYLVHGLLHLMGYDDIEEKDRLLMRAAETRHLQLLEDANLLLRPA